MTTLWPNDVFLSSPHIRGVTYVHGSLTASPDQLPKEANPCSIFNNGDEWKIRISCGRHAEVGLADQFVNLAGGRVHVFGLSSNDKAPRALNFYFSVLVDFELDGRQFQLTLWLGQGHSDRNNWWIGGDHIANTTASQASPAGAPYLCLYAERELVQMYLLAGKSSHVDYFYLNALMDKTQGIKQYRDWLRSIPDNRQVTSLSLPGTHDSAAINAYMHTPFACHYASLTGQLYSGIRLLDIRVSIKEKNGAFEYHTCHGNLPGNEYQLLVLAMDEIGKFLKQNPTEFVAMTLKVDDWNNVSNPEARERALKRLKDLLAPYPTFISKSIPTLKDVRGKIYPLNRIENSLRFGAAVDWVNNTPGSWAPDTTERSFPVYVQDHWNLTTADIKFKDFTDAWKHAADGKMLLNYASGTLGLLGVEINRGLLGAMGDKASRPSRWGWSFFDYEDQTQVTNKYGKLTVIDLVIAANHAYANYPDGYKT